MNFLALLIMSLCPCLISCAQSIEIEEDSEVIIASIRDIDFDDKGERFLLNDKKTGNIFIYSMKGKIIKVIKPGFNLSELAVEYYKQNIRLDTYWIVGKPIMIASLDDYNKYFQAELTAEDFLKHRSNEFGHSRFLNDSIIISVAHIRFGSYEINPNKKKEELMSGALNQSAIIHYNINSNKIDIKYMNPDLYKNRIYQETISLRPFSLFVNGNNYYVYNSNDLIVDTCSMEAPVIVKINNNKKEPYINLPDILQKSNFYYSFLGFWGENLNDDIYCKYSLLPYVYVNNKVAFQLKPHDIFPLDTHFNKYNHSSDINVEMLNTFKFFFLDITLSKENIFVLTSILPSSHDKELRGDYLLQKYTYDGVLLNSIQIDKTKDFKIEKIKYNHADKNLYLFFLENGVWKFKEAQI